MVLKPSFSDNINCGEIYRTNRKQSIQNYIKVCLNENICLKTEYFYCPETMVREAFIQYLQKMGMLFLSPCLCHLIKLPRKQETDFFFY